MSQNAKMFNLRSLKDAKYRGLISLIISFFLLTAIVSFVTSYYTNKSDLAVVELDLVSQQLITEKQLSEDILNMDMYLQAHMTQSGNVTGKIETEALPQEVIYLIQNIEAESRVFNEIVEAIDLNGGRVILEDGREIEIDGIQSDYLRGYVKNIETLWKPYQGLLQNFVKETKSGTVSKQQAEYLVEYVRSYGANLQYEISNLHQGINYFISVQSRAVFVTQSLGAIVALILLFLIVFGALTRLIENDKLLDEARKETTEIMQTVNTGLFLLDKELMIGNQYSNALEGIMGTKRLAGENLTTVLRNRISDKDLETARQFIGQLYNPRVKENLVNDLNPLHKIMFRDEQTSRNRYLDFKFSRVYNDKEIARILVNVNDVSEAVALEQRLEKERAQNDLQIEMLTTILNVHPQIIKEFIANTLARINKINDVLKNPGSSQTELENKLKSIYREMHSLKGEASALKLHNFTKIASESEDKMQILQNKMHLTGNDFLPLTVHLDELLTLANTISKLGERISNPSSSTPVNTAPAETVVAPAPAASTYADFYKGFAREIASRQNKEVYVDVNEAQFEQIPTRLANTVKEMSIQLLRNAIVHGIESAENRVANGKDSFGLINMSVEQVDQNLVLTVKDDGKGIDYASIRLQLVTKGLYTSEQAQELTEAQLLKQLFTSGFSTKSDVDEDGGRGVGLDIIKERLAEFKGQIDVKSKRNQGTQFVITLPL